MYTCAFHRRERELPLHVSAPDIKPRLGIKRWTVSLGRKRRRQRNARYAAAIKWTPLLIAPGRFVDRHDSRWNRRKINSGRFQPFTRQRTIRIGRILILGAGKKKFAFRIGWSPKSDDGSVRLHLRIINSSPREWKWFRKKNFYRTKISSSAALFSPLSLLAAYRSVAAPELKSHGEKTRHSILYSSCVRYTRASMKYTDASE